MDADELREDLDHAARPNPAREVNRQARQMVALVMFTTLLVQHS